MVNRNFGKTFSLLSLSGIITIASLQTYKTRKNQNKPAKPQFPNFLHLSFLKQSNNITQNKIQTQPTPQHLSNETLYI